MAKNNFGVIKATFTNHMNESENLLAKEMFGKFMQMIKESKVLRAQFEIYKNLENKFIPNENLAIKYIDENISIITANYAQDAILTENEKLQPLVAGLDIKVSASKEKLYEHINTLILESCTSKLIPNVDQLHESFEYVLNYVQTNKPKLIESSEVDPAYSAAPNEFLIKKAIEKFNARYSSLNEAEKSIFKSIVSEDVKIKEGVFQNLKDETLDSLKSLLGNSELVDQKINESVSKINTMHFNNGTYLTDVISLNELKSNIAH